MELSTTFRRRVGAVSTDPVLGSDVLPTGLPKVGDAVDNLGTIARCIHAFVAENPIQRIALFHRYTGAGPAVPVVVTPWCYVRETNSWYRLGLPVTLTSDVVSFVDTIAGILPMKAMQPMDTGDSLDSLEVVLLAALPVGAPDGLYDFGAVFDSSLDGSDTEFGGAGMLAELQAIHSRQADGAQRAVVDHPGNYSTARGGDGTAVRLGNTTITFTGPAITSNQLRRVIVVINSATKPLVWVQEVNAILTIAAGVVTVVALDGTAAPIPVTATLISVSWEAQDKGYNPSLNATNNAPMYSDRSFRQTDPTYFVAADQTVTNAWADFGPEVLMDGQTDFRGLFKYTKGDGTITTLQVRALVKHTNAGAEEFPQPIYLPNTGAPPYSLTADDEAIYLSPVDATGLRTLLWKLGNTVKYVQVQVKASTPGTTMLMNKESAYTMGYSS